MIVYVSGPMTGHPDLNRAAFERETQRLQDEDHVVINPAYAFCGHDPEVDLRQVGYERFMRFHIHSILTVDAVVVLPGWIESRGARFEVHMAEILDLPVFYRNEDGQLMMLPPMMTGDTDRDVQGG